jgi:hypothetical protein
MLCEGSAKQSNHSRYLIESILKGVNSSYLFSFVFLYMWSKFILFQGIVPNHWIKYKFPKNTSLSVWIIDFFKRVSQLNSFSASKSIETYPVWLGGLLNFVISIIN